MPLVHDGRIPSLKVSAALRSAIQETVHHNFSSVAVPLTTLHWQCEISLGPPRHSTLIDSTFSTGLPGNDAPVAQNHAGPSTSVGCDRAGVMVASWT